MKQKKPWMLWFVYFIVICIFMALLEAMFFEYQRNQWTARLEKSVNTFEMRLQSKEDELQRLEDTIVERMIGLAKIVASEIVYNHEVDLKQLQDHLFVESINVLNSQGEVMFSSIDSMVGEIAPEDHLSRKLFLQNETILIEEVRPHLITDVSMKFVYLKVKQDYVIQVGVDATRFGMIDPAFILLEEALIDQIIQKFVYVDSNGNCIRSLTSVVCEDFLVDSRTIAAGLPGLIGGRVVVQYNPQEFQSFFWKIRGIVLGLSFLFVLTYFILKTRYQRKQEELMDDLYFDPMTSLPNHRYFFNHVQEVWSSEHVLLMIQLGKLHQINLIQGYPVGDDLILKFVQHIQEIGLVKEVYRMSGDRFLILAKELDREEICKELLRFDYYSHNQLIYDGQRHESISYCECNPQENALFHSKKLDITLRHIHESDHVRCKKFDSIMESKLRREELLVHELEHALRHDASELFIMLQPLYSTAMSKVQGFEVLARFNSEIFGSIPPTEFIDLAERNQLIIPLGAHLFELAAKALKSLHEVGYDQLFVSYNTSILQLMDPGFEAMLLDCLRIYKLLPANVEIEITETVFETNRKELVSRIQRLRQLGFSVAIDDFGTGYSSLGMMLEMSVDQIKIDRRFIQSILVDPHKTIIPELMSIAKKAGCFVTAEGVEETAQMDYLINIGCDILQGYGISRPLVYDDFILFMEKR